MQTRGLDPATRLIAARPESAGEAVAAALGLEPGSPTLYLERLRLADGEPLLLEQVHLPAERFPGLLASDLEHGSLYDLLTERYGVRVARAREVAGAGPAARSRGPPARAQAGHAGAADRRHRLHGRRDPGRARPDVRARRSHALLRGTSGRPAAVDARAGDAGNEGGGTDPCDRRTPARR